VDLYLNCIYIYIYEKNKIKFRELFGNVYVTYGTFAVIYAGGIRFEFLTLPRRGVLPACDSSPRVCVHRAREPPDEGPRASSEAAVYALRIIIHTYCIRVYNR